MNTAFTSPTIIKCSESIGYAETAIKAFDVMLADAERKSFISESLKARASISEKFA